MPAPTPAPRRLAAVARVVPWLLFALAALAPLLAAAAEPTLSPSALWRLRIAEAREAKLWIASAAAALLALGLALRLAGRGQALQRLRDALLVGLALATLFAWWHPYRGSLRAWLHVGDTYHYYMGAKYFPELGYTRLYRCSVVADAEEGLAAALARSQIRNLESNRLESAQLSLRNPGECKRHFSPERWQSFKRDLRFFRSKLTIPLWFKLRVDHGYNPPPTWTVVGSLLAGTAPEPGRSQFLWLTALDPLLIATMFAALAWGFGWRTMCVAAIYWGANQPASWEWVGGSIVRFDWLAASGAAIACLRRGRPATAGALVAWAAAIRIFPAAIAAGVVASALLHMLRERSPRPPPEALRFALAFGAVLALLVAVSSALVGPGSWLEFARNSRLHVATDSVNRGGLRPLLAHRHEERLAVTLEPQASDPYARWRELRARSSEARRPLLFAVVSLHLVLLGLALRRQPAWVAGVLGIGAVPVLLELGSYYFGFLLLFACLGSRWREIDVALLALAAFTWWVGTWGGPDRDVVVARTSLALVVFVMGVTARIALARNGSQPAAPGVIA